MESDPKTRKGQSAIEYLTTYGWMLLVIAIIGGAIFSNVQNSAQIQSVSGLSNTDVQVDDYGLNDNGLQLSLRAAASDQVEIQKIEIKDGETGITADISPDEVLALDDTAQVNLEDTQSTETSDTFDMEITYDTGGLEGLTAEGQITGSFGVFNRLAMTDAEFNRSTNRLQVTVENKGDNTTDSISYSVEANNTDYAGSLPNLASGEEAQINISTDETYPLESVNLDTEGTQFVNSESRLKCTPTKRLVGYWTFNEEQTKNGWAVDLSGQENNGSLKNGVSTGIRGKVGEAYSFEDNNGYINIGKMAGLGKRRSKSLSLIGWMSWKSTGQGTFLGVHQQEGFLYWRNNRGFSGGDSEGDTALMVRADSNTDFWYSTQDLQLNDGKWHHISSSLINGSNNKGKIFISSKDNTVKGEADNPQTPAGFKNDIYIGSQNKAGPENFYDGKMDEVRIYNRSLSQQEIQRLYNVRSEDWAVSGCKVTG